MSRLRAVPAPGEPRPRELWCDEWYSRQARVSGVSVNRALIVNGKLDDSYYSPGFGPFGFDLYRAFRVGERAGRVVHLETHRGAVTPAPRVTGRD